MPAGAKPVRKSRPIPVACLLVVTALPVLQAQPALPLAPRVASASQLVPPVIRLERMSTGTLSNPVFVGNAHDGSNRLFIVERDGRIRVLPPGAGAATVFLDISSRLLAGGEQGLLGLAFHPDFRTNRRFFVDYTRTPDGATVIAEYHASSTDPNLADASEKAILVIPQPYANHNGGMLAFGSDGFLYIGMGDGGSANDPQNRAQNIEELLGKILRIDVDHPENVDKPYSSPADNPYYDLIPGRDEIYALGLRNPWRFSFDRWTGQLWAGDVGQNQIEEADVIAKGGNYGWRVHEGVQCTNLGPAGCIPGNFAMPILEYTHIGSRCAITGGYVYRGSSGTLPSGSYIYGDYCSGEIMLWYGNQQFVLLDTALAISSFGEDESGELYVVGLGGSVDRIVNDSPVPRMLYLPMIRAGAGFASFGASEYTSLALANPTSRPATVRLTAYGATGEPLTGNNLTNPVSLFAAPFSQIATFGFEIFGAGLSSIQSPAWVRVESNNSGVSGLYIEGNSDFSAMDGTELASATMTSFVIPAIEPADFNRIHLVNPGAAAVNAALELTDQNGARLAAASRNIAAGGCLAELPGDLFPGVTFQESDYIRVSSDSGLVPYALSGRRDRYLTGVSGLDAALGDTTLFSPQYVTGTFWRSTVAVINLEAFPAQLTLQLVGEDATPLGVSRQVSVAPRGKFLLDDPGFFGTAAATVGYLRISSSGPRLAGCVTFGDRERQSIAATLPLQSRLQRWFTLSHIVSNSLYYTGLALLNPGSQDAAVELYAYGPDGRLLGGGKQLLPPGQKRARLLTELLPELAGATIDAGYLRIEANQDIAAYAVFGTYDGSSLSAIPAQSPQ